MIEKNLTTEERLAALRPIASLISKSEKAMQKLTPQTWQHSTLKENIASLRVASLLIQGKTGNSHAVLQKNLEETISPIATMIDKAEKALVKYLPGTAQHSLLRNWPKSVKSTPFAPDSVSPGVTNLPFRLW